MSQTFMNISSETCRQVYPEILANAARHRRCAAILATQQEYPNAMAHLILGTEELLKGLVILLESRGMRLRQIEGFKKIFSDHKSRHYVLRDLVPIWLVIKKIFEEFENPTAKSRLKTGAPSWWKVLIGAISVAKEGLSGYMQYKFWNDADDLKQKALYVDFKDEISTPASATVGFYDIVNLQVEKVTKEVMKFIEEMENATPEESKAFIQKAMDDDFRELLSKTISGKHSLFSQ